MSSKITLRQQLKHIPYYPNAITAKGLSKVWNVKDSTDTSRAVRRVIRALISIGCPVISGSRGYSRAKNVDDLSDHIMHLQQRLKAVRERIVDLQWIVAYWEDQT